MKATYPFILALIFLTGCSSHDYAELGGKRISIEIAQTPDERATGLMFRESLCEKCGMLFIFEEDNHHPLWMKNTLMPLDMVFISSEMKVVDVLHAEPCDTEECLSYVPKEKAKYALEANAYTFDETIIGKKMSLKEV